jgi:UDP-N-acetylmuramoyl-L-alanyl-D-glutamate--2,6-diaminopimelate ligase
MQLSTILNNITNVNFSNLDIQNITLDSRKANKGYLFCAIKGHSVDARKFIEQTIKQNVSAILADSDTEDDYIELSNDVQIIYIHNLNSKLSQIADNFYQQPSKKLELIGITGTNGKTTISQIICQWNTILGKKTATMGTIGNGIYGDLKESENTTGSALDIQQNIYDFVNLDAKVATMEVSSHGLVQGRVSALDFDICIFTNLTQDHLDYHKTMENYFDAKATLFTNYNSKYNVINIDDSYGLKLIDKIKDKKSIFAVSVDKITKTKGFANYIYAKNITYSKTGINLDFVSNFGNGTINTKLIGKFNVSNILQSLATMLAAGYSIDELIVSASKLSPVVGRMEVFENTNMPTIIVDYAHTHDALEKALQAARIHTKGNLWCIFGCGGDRDTAKRPLMAQSAEKFADNVIITNDNPRTEDEDIIIKDILTGISSTNPIIIKDRFEALEYAVENANKDDIILAAGKGHEDYQVIGTQKVHYSDRESAIKLLQL